MKPLVLAGPSASGKTTVANLLLAKGNFSFVKSVTTRPPRTPDDDEYTFVDGASFERMKAGGELLESVTYAGTSYGTPRSELDRIGREGKIPLLILDTVGVGSVKAAGASPFAVYFCTPLDTCEERLYQRTLGAEKTPDALMTFMKRKEANIRDYAAADEFLPFFDVFVKGEGTPDALADEILCAYEENRTATEDERRTCAQFMKDEAARKDGFRFQR